MSPLSGQSDSLHQVQRQARVAADFGRAATGYDSAARLQQQVGRQLLDLFSPSSVTAEAAGNVLDLGCGTGYFLPVLQQQFNPCQLTAVDLSPAMLAYARDSRPVTAVFIAAPAESVPLVTASYGRIFSSLMVQWCQDLPRVLGEMHRLLAPGGEAVVSTLVDGTLTELRDAWGVADPGVAHVNHFLPRAELEQQVRTVFADAEMNYETVTLWYPDALALLRELKTLGARHKDGGRQSATSPGRLRALSGAYNRYRVAEHGLPASYQVAYMRFHKPEQ